MCDGEKRYEVRCKHDDSEEEHVVGFTNDPTGGKLVEGVNLHPSFHSPRVVERTPQGT